MLRPVAALGVAIAVLATARVVRAEDAEVATAVVLRAQPSEKAPVAARLSAGTAVTLVGHVADGSWLQVRSGVKKGWANKGFFKRLVSTGAASANSSAESRAAPAGPSLAPPRAHLDGWVAQSTWSRRQRLDAEVLQACEVHQRTDEESRVVTTLTRGQRIVLTRMSADEAWGLVRQDGSDVGWVAMSVLRVRGPARTDDADEAPVDTRPPVEQPSPSSADALVLRARPSLPDRRNALALTAQAGVAALSRRFVSNGAGAMAAYELSTTAVASGVSGSYARQFGAHGVVGADLSYAYAAGAHVQYVAGDGSMVKVRLQQHDAEGGLHVGVHTRAAGGVDAWLRAGALLTVTIVDPDATVRLQSDRLIAPTAGVGVEARHLATLAGHWLGVGLFARAVLYGQLTDNLKEGADRGTWGGRFGGDLSLELLRTPARGQLLLAAGYGYAFTVSRFSGPSQRDATATQATLGTAQHVATAALGYSY